MTPPAEFHDKPGWHWIKRPNGRREPWHWSPKARAWTRGAALLTGPASYYAPCPPPPDKPYVAAPLFTEAPKP